MKNFMLILIVGTFATLTSIHSFADDTKTQNKSQRKPSSVAPDLLTGSEWGTFPDGTVVNIINGPSGYMYQTKDKATGKTCYTFWGSGAGVTMACIN